MHPEKGINRDWPGELSRDLPGFQQDLRSISFLYAVVGIIVQVATKLHSKLRCPDAAMTTISKSPVLLGIVGRTIPPLRRNLRREYHILYMPSEPITWPLKDSKGQASLGASIRFAPQNALDLGGQHNSPGKSSSSGVSPNRPGIIPGIMYSLALPCAPHREEMSLQS